jgi:hypothetical protein
MMNNITTQQRKMIVPFIDYRFSCSVDDGPMIVAREPAILGNLTLVSVDPCTKGDDASGLRCRNNSALFLTTNDGIASTSRLTSTGTIRDLTPFFDQHITSITTTNTTLSTTTKSVDVVMTGLALEVWFTPTSSQSNNSSVTTDTSKPKNLYPIVSVSQSSNHDSNDIHDSNGDDDNHEDREVFFCDNLQLLLAQSGTNQIELRYKDRRRTVGDNNNSSSTNSNAVIPTATGYTCRSLVFPNLELQFGRLHHIIVVWGGGQSHLQIFVNGTPVLSIPSMKSTTEDHRIPFWALQFWDPNYRLHVFSDLTISPTAIFPGTIHQVSFYNTTLMNDDVLQLYQQGVQERQVSNNITAEEDGDGDEGDGDDDNDDDANGGFTFDPSRPLRLVASLLNLTSASVVQGRSASLQLGGDLNTSTMFWDVAVEIMTLPMYGDLLKIDDTSRIRDAGSRIVLLGQQTRTVVRYQQRLSDENYFSIPTSSWNGTRLSTADMPLESVSFRLVAISKDDPPQVYGVSETVEQTLSIIHRNHQPSILAPYIAKIPDQQPSLLGGSPSALIENITIFDPDDYDIDQIRVDVHAENGTVSILDDEVRALADFDSCTNRRPAVNHSDLFPLASLEAWSCQGNGIDDRVMTFIATPGDATRILSNLRYDFFQWEQEGAVNLAVYDGSGGPCLDEAEHIAGRVNITDYQTIHGECFRLSHRIHVPAVGRPAIIKDDSIEGQTIFIVIIVSIVLGCVCCCFLCGFLGYVVQVRTRSAPIEVMKTAGERGQVLQDEEGIQIDQS